MHSCTRLTAAIFLAAVLTACTTGDDTATDTMALDTAPGAIVPGPVTPPDTSAGSAATTGGADLVHVPLDEWTLSVGRSVIPAGTHTFHAMNQGTYTHAFEIEGNGREWKSDPIAPGGTATLTPTLTAGTYEVYCPIVDSHGNHQQRGMRTTFTVN